MKCFAKIVKNYNYFFKAFILQLLLGSEYAYVSNKYSSICRVTLRYVFYHTYS